MHNDETVISDCAPDMINKTPIIPGHSPESVAGMISSGSEHKNTTITTTTVTTDVDTVTIDTNTSNTTPTTTSESVPVPGPGPVGVAHGIGSVVSQVAVAEKSVTGSGSGIHNGNASVTSISCSSTSDQRQQQDGHELDTTTIANKSLNTTTSTAIVEEEQKDNPKTNNSVTDTSLDKTPDQQQDIIPLRAKPAPHQPDHSLDHPIDHPGHHPKDPQQHPGDPSDDPQAQAEPSGSNHNHHPGHCPCAQPEPGSQPPASSLPSTYIRSSPLTSEPLNGPKGGDHHDSTIQPNNQQPSHTMIFSDLYKSPRSPLNKLRHSFPHHQPSVVLPPDLDADLVSKDKAKQKEAVRKYLLEKIRNDWEFEWPPVTQSQSQSPTGATPTSNEKQQQQQDKSDIAQQPPSDSTVAPNEHGSHRIAADEAAVIETCDDAIALRDPGEVADSESDAESVYSTISEDLVHYRPRAEWTSDLSDNDEPQSAAAATSSSSPFRFDSPDAVGTAVKSSLEAKRAKRRRAVRDEASWNPGLACFEARRDAWTGAKTVRVKPMSPMSPTTGRSSTTRRLSFWRHHPRSSESNTNAPPVGSPPATTNLTAPLSPTTTRTSQQSAQSDAISDTSATRGAGTGGGNATDTTVPSTSISSAPENNTSHYPVQTLLPLPPPLLPPQNPMRASVTPSIYPSLYDKIIINNMQPSCPVNLSDMLRACVVGWKRDGEWPPKSQYTNVAAPPMPVPKPMSTAEIAAQRQRKIAAQKQMQAQKEARERVAKEAEEVRERAREAARQQREERDRIAREQREQREERERLERQEKEAQKAERQAEKQRRKSDATAQAAANGAGGRRSSIVALVGGVVNHLTRVPTAEDRERSGSQESDENNGGGNKGGIRRSLQKVFSLGHGGGLGNGHGAGHAA